MPEETPPEPTDSAESTPESKPRRRWLKRRTTAKAAEPERRKGIFPPARQSMWFFLLIMLGALVLTWQVFQPFVLYMVTGVFVAVLALPIDKRWERIFPNRVAAFFTMFTLLLIILVPVVVLGALLLNDAQKLTDALQEGKFEDWVLDWTNEGVGLRVMDLWYPEQTSSERNATVLGYVDEARDFMIDQLTQLATKIVTSLPQFAIALTVILFVVYYVLTDGEKLVAYLRRAAPLPNEQVTYLLREARNGLHAVFAGQILTSLIQGGLGGIMFLILGIPGAVVWAAVMAILSLLPVVGAFLVWIPAAIWLFATGSVGKAIVLAVWGTLIVSQVDNFIRPRLIGNRANIHPIFVLIGVLGGVAAFGFMGLFLGPLIVGIALSVLRVWESDYLDPTVGSQDPTRDDA